MEPGGDLILDADLTRTGGPVDVAGGWFDAGDYLKFTHSSAYNDVLLFTSARQLGRRAPKALVAEARHGLAWLSKMWDPTTRTLHIQVGIGSGNEQGTFLGDHDGWRLPEADDHDTAVEDRYVSHRPVFDAAPAGKPISPNLVGRVAASYALAAQLDARAPSLAGAGRAAPGDPALLPRRHRQPAPPARHGAAARLLPRGHLARRHGARRRRDRAGPAGPAPGQRRLRREGGALGARLPRAGDR